jgi:hypothetical protein
MDVEAPDSHLGVRGGGGVNVHAGMSSRATVATKRECPPQVAAGRECVHTIAPPPGYEGKSVTAHMCTDGRRKAVASCGLMLSAFVLCAGGGVG